MFRQEETVWVEALGELRVGKVSPKTYQLLRRYVMAFLKLRAFMCACVRAHVLVLVCACVHALVCIVSFCYIIEILCTI